jgi:hypothetical protein
MSSEVLGLSETDLTKSLAYAGFVLLAYELVRSLIVEPIKLFYRDTTFEAGPFKSYEVDVKARHKMNRPGFRRHLAAINYGLGGGGYEHEAVHR